MTKVVKGNNLNKYVYTVINIMYSNHLQTINLKENFKILLLLK